MKRLLVICVVGLLLLPWAAFAQEETKEHDALELSAYAGLSAPMGGVKDWNNMGAKTGFNGGVAFGAFLSDKITLGLNLGYNQFSINSSQDLQSQKHRVFSPAAYLRYYFQGNSNIVPYVKLQAGLDFVKFSTLVQDNSVEPPVKYRELGYSPGFAFGAGAGVFLYTSDYGGFFLEGNLHEGLTQNVSHTFKGTDYTFGKNLTLIDIHAGFHVFFGHK